jgi:hypothetical protein
MMPLFNWIPAQSESNLILAESRFFLRDPRLIVVKGRAERTLFSQQPLEDILVIAEALPRATRVKIKISNRRKVWHLADNSSDWTIIRKPRPNFPLLRNGYAYKVELRSGTDRPALVGIAATPLEKAILLYRISRYREAARYLEKLPQTKTNPSLKNMLQLSRIKAGIAPPDTPLPRENTNTTAEAITAAYGIAPALLERLPYITIPPEQLKFSKNMKLLQTAPCDTKALFSRNTSNAVPETIYSNFIPLPEGHYQLTINGNINTNASKITCQLLDISGNQISTAAGSEPTDNQILFHLHKPPAPPAVQIVIHLPPDTQSIIHNLEIHPHIN